MRRAAVLFIVLAVLPVGQARGQVATADAEPPAAFLAGASGEVAGARGSSCWTQPGSTTGRCVDRPAPAGGPTLSVRRGETLTLRFTTALALTQLVARRDGVELDLPVANPSRFRVDLTPGTYQLGAFARFSAGDAFYAFQLRVTAPPATPTPAPRVALTG